MHKITSDEYFTINTVHPNLTPEKTVYRALHGPRIFTYLFYPGALVGMNTHMGGNVYVDGWKYPGHNYFTNNYEYQMTMASMKRNMEDPNLRYFHYYLTLQSIIFVFLSFIPLLFYLWKNNYFVALFMMSSLIGINFLFLDERNVFYIEPLLLSMFNILIWLYLYLKDKIEIGLFLLVFISFIFALTFSLKFSSLFLIVLVAILIVSKSAGLESRLKTLTFLILFSSVFFYLINWDIFSSKEVFNTAVHDYFSNFWHYATGHKAMVSENYQIENFKKILEELFSSLGGLLFLIPIIILFGLIQLSYKNRIIWGGLIATIFLSVALIAKQKIYVDRNILPFLPAIVLITGVMLDMIFKRLWEVDYFQKHKSAKRYAYILLVILVFLPISVKSKNYLRTVFPSSRENIENALSSIKDKEKRRLVRIGYHKDLNDVQFKSEVIYESAPETSGANFSQFIVDYGTKLETDDVILVSEIGNNKQLTNYLLPILYNSNVQYADHYIFYNDISKNKPFADLLNEFNDKRNQELYTGSMKIRQDLILKGIKLARKNNMYRIYFMFDFLSQKIEKCRFSFHGIPYEKDTENLPEERIKYGYENLDFTTEAENWMRFGTKLFVVHDFKPSLMEYSKWEFRIFKGCPQSKHFSVSDIKL